MNDKIESCFMDEQPEFFTPVVFNGREIAVVRALTDEDREVLNEMGGVVFFEDDGVLKSKITKPKSYENYLLVLTLGGTINGYSYKRGREGWIWNRPVNFESISLIADRYRKAMIDVVVEHLQNWEKNKESLLKN